MIAWLLAQSPLSFVTVLHRDKAKTMLFDTIDITLYGLRFLEPFSKAFRISTVAFTTTIEMRSIVLNIACSSSYNSEDPRLPRGPQGVQDVNDPTPDSRCRLPYHPSTIRLQ